MAEYTLADDTTPPKTLRHTTFLARRLRGQPIMASTRDTLNMLLDDARKAEASWIEERDERISLTAERQYLDGELGDLYVTLGAHALLCVGRDRDDPDYRAAFPEAPSEVVRPMATQGQSDAVAATLAELPRSGRFVSIVAQMNDTQAGLDALNAVRAARDAALVRERAARIEFERRAELVRLAHNGVYPVLLQHFPTKKAMIRSFYYAQSYERDGDEQA